MKLDERNQKNIKIPPFFISMATAAKFVLPIPISLAYLVPLDVDVTGNITANICEVWSEFNILCTLVTMESKNLLNPHFFVSMATTAKFVQPIPIVFAYLVPLDVDVVPIKFHQFLFGE
jgi:hypothetical protein